MGLPLSKDLGEVSYKTFPCCIASVLEGVRGGSVALKGLSFICWVTQAVLRQGIGL